MASRYQHKLSTIFSEYWSYSKGYRYLIIPAALGMFVDAILQSMLVAYLKIVIDELVKDPTLFIQAKLLRYALFGLVMGLVFFPFAFFGHISYQMISFRQVVSFRMALYRHLQKLSLNFFHQLRVGEISSRVTGDIDNGVNGLMGYFITVLWCGTMLTTSLVNMIILSWQLTIVFVFLAALYTLVSKVFLPRIRVFSRAVRDQSGELNAQVTEDIAAVALVKAFAREERFFSRFQKSQNLLYGSQVRMTVMNSIYSDVLQVISLFLAPIIILGTASYMVRWTGITVGTVVAFWSYWMVMRGPLSSIFNSMTILYGAMASMDRVMEFFDKEPMPKDMPNARSVVISGGTVEFRNVTFAYKEPKTNPVLRDISFVIPGRSSMGIVGPSGAGKSTLLQLMIRFFDPDSGAILVDGHNLRELTQDSLRRNFGVVLQDSLLLAGTIRENLLLGRENATDAEIWKALEQAAAKDFVEALPEKLDAELGERGVNLSGGQRQRLSIARVLIRNPALVVLDEATSALDSASEAHVRQSIRTLLSGRTSIIIAHRLLGAAA